MRGDSRARIPLVTREICCFWGMPNEEPLFLSGWEGVVIGEAEGGFGYVMGFYALFGYCIAEFGEGEQLFSLGSFGVFILVVDAL